MVKKMIPLRTLAGAIVFSIPLSAPADMVLPAHATKNDNGTLHDDYKDITVDRRALVQTQLPWVNMRAPRSQTLKVTAWVDRPSLTYYSGEEVVLWVKAKKRDAYVTVLDIGTSGKSVIIFPNHYQPNNRISAGQTVRIPAKASGATLRVSGPGGSELIKVIATSRPFAFAPKDVKTLGPYKSLTKSSEVMAKDLDVLLRQENVEWDDYDKVIKIVATPKDKDMALISSSTAGETGSILVGSSQPSFQQPSAQQPSLQRSSVPHNYSKPLVVGTSPSPYQPQTTLPPRGEYANSSMQPVAPQSQQCFALHLRTDKEFYRIGEKVNVRVTPERDCYLTVVNKGSSGQQYVLFPNRYQQDNLIRGGQTIIIPGDNAPVDFQLSGPSGIETLVGTCSTGPQPLHTAQYDFNRYTFQPLKTKDLRVVNREETAIMAHTSTTFMVGQ